MQQGLGIGIASWIDTTAGDAGLPAFPATPIAFELRHIGLPEKPADLVRATELALLANRVGDGGPDHDLGGVAEYLWDRHRETIGEMVAAISTLSAAEREALARADAVLYEPDGLTISDRYALYNETRRIHEDLVLAGAPAAEVQQAYESWVTIGHKAAVEEALATKVTLSRSTSRLIAAGDVTRIQVALDAMGGDLPFAPTLFTPVSASSTEHWTEAEVDFQALEDAIRPEVPRAGWRRFRGTKSGAVRFRFVVAELIRPWFSPALYAADDWRLADGAEGVVADGMGRAGRLPAYYSRLYLAQVLDIRHDTVKPGSGMIAAGTPARPPTGPVGSESGLVMPPPPRPGTVVGRPPLRPPTVVARPGMVHPTPRPRGVAAGPTAVAAGHTRAVRGVVATARPLIAADTVRPVVTASSTSRFERIPHLRLGSAGRIARIQKLTAVTAVGKLHFAQAQLAAPSTTEAPTLDRSTWLVGFGRTNLPACPNPNPTYDWP